MAFLLFFSSLGWSAPSFVTEGGPRLSSAAIQAATGAYPALRVYYIRNGLQVNSALTSDGQTFVEDPGVRLSTTTAPLLDVSISSITGLSILPLNGGGFRMVYSITGSTAGFRIHSATSADGLAWANSTGTVVNLDNGTTFAQYPSLVELSGGDWRMYYIQNSATGNQAANHQVFSALSTNEGANFSTGTAAVAAQAGQVSATLLTNNKVRLHYTSSNTLVSWLSTDIAGSAFTAEGLTRFSTTSILLNPFITRSTDSFRWRMYYSVDPSSDVFSATTNAPDPQRMTPPTAFSNGGVISFTILGDIFSAAPTALLRQSGQNDVAGSGLVRTDDQTLTVNFNVQGLAKGPWNLIVSNDDGTTGTLSNALTMDFQAGEITLLDNLIRPREGTRTKATVTIGAHGRVTLKVYAITGEPVSTLLNSDLAPGTYNVFWDGKTGSGAAAASGVYVLKAKGPKLDVTRKIVLIR